MTTQQEATCINELLPQMAQRPSSFNISQANWQGTVPNRQELHGLAHRLVAEGLAVYITEESKYRLSITPVGKEVAEGNNGYLGHLARQAQQQRVEERRAERSANGSWISGIAAALGIGLSIYSLYSGAQDAGELKAQIAAQARRIQALEIQLKQHKH